MHTQRETFRAAAVLVRCFLAALVIVITAAVIFGAAGPASAAELATATHTAVPTPTASDTPTVTPTLVPVVTEAGATAATVYVLTTALYAFAFGAGCLFVAWWATRGDA